MSTLREALTEYISMRRALGYKLRMPANALPKFVSFLEEKQASFITTSLALEWAQQPATAQASLWAQKLGWVRGFALYRSASDNRTEIPPFSLLPHKAKRVRPYLYTDIEIQQLLQAALELEDASEIRRRTLYCVLGLLAVSGMRVNEALKLKVTNIDFDAEVLTVEDAKFGKSRLIPLHASTRKALSEYKCLRDEFLGNRKSQFFFINNVGNRLDDGTLRRIFYLLSRQVGLRKANANHGPRLLDLRHRFAVRTMLNWYQNGEDVERRLPVLSTFLGHVHVNDTYWYLSAYPELMGEAVMRLEKRWEVNS